jgi:hypothetical protein
VSNSRNTELAERQARLARVKADQRRSERKRTWLIASVVGVIVLGLAGTTVAIVRNEGAKNTAIASDAKGPIKGVKTFTGLERNHVKGTVHYAQNPPTGGNHDAIPQNCGFYSAPIRDENGVHSLEHGAVWIAHAPNLPADQLDTLRAFASKSDHVLVSPRDTLPAPVVASAWGVQLQLDSADDTRLAAFLHTYVNGPTTPEPGAPCSGGVGTPG